MSGEIFISYRREDSAAWAGRLSDRLSARFPQSHIFMDVDMDLGIDFVEEIEKNVGACDVLIVVIGRHWLSSADEEGRRRLDNPEDFVRLEIGTALKRGIRVIPVLVEGALMPQSGQLPDDLKLLARRNALNISHDRFRADAERLNGAVERALESARVELQRKREEQERVDAERREREEKERLEIGCRREAAQDRLEAERQARGRLQAERRETEHRQRKKRERLQAKPDEKECLETQRRQREEHMQQPSEETPRISVSPTPSTAGWLAEVQHYVDAKDYANALPLLQRAAQAGDADALYRLGELCLYGRGVARSYGQARQWFEKAADAGSANAMSGLGLLYRKGWGVIRNYGQARRWYQGAANAGNADGMYRLGELYDRGWGVVRDYGQARQWYQKAAAAGNADAMYSLGYLYDKGQGVDQDYGQARQWYQKAADAGSTDAKRALSRLPSK